MSAEVSRDHKIAEAKARYNLDAGDEAVYNHRTGKRTVTIVKIGYSHLFDEVICLVNIVGDPILHSVDIGDLEKTEQIGKKNPNSTFKRRSSNDREK